MTPWAAIGLETPETGPLVVAGVTADGVLQLKTKGNGTILVPRTTILGIWSHPICKGERAVAAAAVAWVAAEWAAPMMEEPPIGVSNLQDPKDQPQDPQVNTIILHQGYHYSRMMDLNYDLIYFTELLRFH